MWRDKFGLKSYCTVVSRQAVQEVDIGGVCACVCCSGLNLPIKWVCTHMALLVNLLVIVRETPQSPSNFSLA